MNFSTSELTNLRSAQTTHMMDECCIQAVVQTKNSYGEMVETWPSDATAQACSLDMRPGGERRSGEFTALEYDATIRLAITATPNARDHIKVTKRFGESVTPLVFEIVGPIQRSASAVQLKLKRVET